MAILTNAERVGNASVNIKVLMPSPDNKMHEHWFTPIRKEKQNDFTRAAARLFMSNSGPGYTCRVCNELTHSTGGGGWWQDINRAINHVIKEHPEAVKQVASMAGVVAQWVNYITPKDNENRQYKKGVRG